MIKPHSFKIRTKMILKMKLKIGLILVLIYTSVHDLDAQKLPDESIKKIDQPELIEGIGKLLNERYLFVDSAEKIHHFLSAQHADGAYENVETARQLGTRITDDLRANFHDRHLRVMYAPRLVNVLNEGTPSEPTEEEIEYELKTELYKNFQLPQLNVLPGNIGYLRIDTFLPPRYARGYGEKMAACFEFVGDTDALIIDLRENPGGYADGSSFFLSYLLPPNKHIISETSRIPNGGLEELQGYTPDTVRARGYLEKPLYVLTSTRTASAAEAVTHILKYSNRATIIGESTYGAGYLGDDFPINDKYIMRVSYASAKYPDAPSNWEGIGVQPDVNASYGDALTVARALAAQDLLSLEKEKSKKEQDEMVLKNLEWEDKRLSNMKNPTNLSQAELEQYKGSYEDRRVVLEGSTLYYFRTNPDRPKRKLTPVGKDEFLVEGLESYRIGFNRDQSDQINAIKLYSIDRLFISKKTD